MINYNSLNQNTVYVAFSSGDAWYSKLIKWFTRSKFSHSFILYYNQDYEQWMALGEDMLGFQFTPASFENTIAIADVPVNLWVGLKKNVNELGSMYAYLALLGMIWVEIGWHIFKKKWHNPLVSNSRWFCSEMCTKLLQDSGLELNLVPGDTDPQVLYNALKNTSGVVVSE